MLEPAEREGPDGFDDVVQCGVGATSRVFRARDRRTGHRVALKRLHRQLVKNEQALARLKREFVALSNLRHESLVPVTDVVSWGGDPTLVMAFVDGEDLKERIVREERLSIAETERIARALFDVLALTHGSGIVHRDVKPQNVRLTQSGRLFLLDFGSARLDASSLLTATGTTVGTPEYMAPELFAGPVYDPRVDLYGVGATLYECLTGRPPQSADSLTELAHLRMSADVRPVRELRADVPEALARVVDRCLARAPEDRFPSASLASWSLDHPEAERALAARRAANPLCLHCGNPIASERGGCPACYAMHPFRYAPGPSHVVLSSVENASRFLEHVVQRFPERASPSHLVALAERCAALSYGRQRYVSFVSDADADRVVKELREVGVRAEVTREPTWTINVLLTCLLLPVFWLRPALALFAGAGGVLSTSRLPRPIAPALFAALTSALALVPLGAFFFSHQAFWGSETFWMVMWTLGSVWIAALFLGFEHRPMRAHEAAEPPAEDAIRGALFASPPSRSASAVTSAAPPLALAAVLTVVMLEYAGLFAADMATTPPVRVVGATAPAETAPRVTPAADATTVSAPARAPRASVTTPASSPATGATSALWSYAGAGLGALAIVVLTRRRIRIRRDAAVILAELDLPAFARQAQRTAPVRNEIARAAWLPEARSDAFAAEAVRRAADLMPLLPRESAAQLYTAIDALVDRRAPSAESERSLLARCILETDPRQRLRFDLLALEGRCEAMAAVAWVDHVEARAGRRGA